MNNKLPICLAAVFGFTCAGILAQGDTRVYVNGERVNGEAFIKDDRTYIPLRAVSEAMGAEVSWDSETGTATVSFTEDDAVAKIVENVSPSVVAIVGNYMMQGESSKYNNLTAHGTGIVIKSNGTILTNAHVVKDISNITVILQDGSSVAGRVLYMDEIADLAVVKIDKIGLKPITMAKKEDIVSGKTAIAIGTPLSLSMRNTVTKGVVSGGGVTINDSYYRLIQTDTAINPGNSGGPLLNTKGEMIGVNSSKYESVSIDSVAFAIPIDTVEYVLNQFEKNGKVLRPETGMSMEQSWEAKIGLPTNKGITVKSSSNGVLLANDEITAVNGVAVHSITDWNEAIKDTFNGTSLEISYIRNAAAATAVLTVSVK